MQFSFGTRGSQGFPECFMGFWEGLIYDGVPSKV